MKILTDVQIKEAYNKTELDQFPFISSIKAVLQAQLDQDREEKSSALSRIRYELEDGLNVADGDHRTVIENMIKRIDRGDF